MAFTIIISHSFLKISLKFCMWFRKYEDFLGKYWQFSSIFCVFWHFLFTKKLIMLAYNKWCQHFYHFQPTINRLFNNCMKLYWFLLEIWKWRGGEGGGSKLTPRKKLSLRSPTLLGWILKNFTSESE